MNNQMNNQRNSRQLSADEEKHLKEKYIREYKQERRKIWIKFLPIVCIAAIVIVFAVVVLTHGGDNSGDSVDSFNGSTYVDENGNLVVPEGFDYLPENAVGSWEVTADSHVLQSPRNGDMSETDALNAESQSEVMLAYDSFKTGGISEVNSPCYKVTENCQPNVLDSVGIQSDGIWDEFGGDVSITKIEVYNNDGKTLADTVFLINDTYLVYYGTGNFVFAAVKIEAVG